MNTSKHPQPKTENELRNGDINEKTKLRLNPPRAFSTTRCFGAVKSVLDDYCLKTWQRNSGQISADQKEIVRQVLSEKSEFDLEIETIEKMSEFMETYKQTTFYAAARWVFGLEQTRSNASRRKRKPCPHPPDNLRTPEGHVVLSKLLKRYDKVHKSRRENCRLDCKEFASNCRLMVKIGRENARRKIEWHEKHGYWRTGFIYYDEEFDCPDCQADQDNQ